jgi:general stress protein YciG
MAGNKIGGIKAAAKNKANDPNFYVKIGSLGGVAGTGHKFAHGKFSPRKAGKIGGRKSRRTYASK